MCFNIIGFLSYGYYFMHLIPSQHLLHCSVSPLDCELPEGRGCVHISILIFYYEKLQTYT